jgi:hypothetical protein
MKKILLTYLMFILPQITLAEVWQDTHEWDQSYETAYSQWFEKNVTPTFFTQGKYGGIKTDCADAAYYTRAIFAYENGLPFEYSILGSQKPVTNRTARYDDTPEGLPRLKMFFEKMADYVSTQSLHLDTYPVAVRPEYIKPGTVVNHRSTGFLGTVTHHVDMVQTVNNNGHIVYISSTLPADIRELTLTYSLRSQPEDEKTQRQGFRSWFWPQNRGKKMDVNLGYSTEQYTASNSTSNYRDSSVRTFNDFDSFVKQRLKTKNISQAELEQQAAIEVCTQFSARVGIIKSGDVYKSRIGHRCMNAREYDDYSTPTRDTRLRQLTEKYIINFIGREENRSATSNLYKIKDKLNNFCQEQEIIDGQFMSFYDFLKIMVENPTSLSSNPNVSIEARWGLKFENSECMVYE